MDRTEPDRHRDFRGTRQSTRVVSKSMVIPPNTVSAGRSLRLRAGTQVSFGTLEGTVET
jgi:hypothetical protein